MALQQGKLFVSRGSPKKTSYAASGFLEVLLAQSALWLAYCNTGIVDEPAWILSTGTSRW